MLTAVKDGVVIRSQFSSPFFRSDDFRTQPFGEINQGQQILGKVTPAYENENGNWVECEFFDLAEIFVVSHPAAENLKSIPEHHVLIVRKEDVEWSYRAKQGMKEHFPHFFND